MENTSEAFIGFDFDKIYDFKEMPDKNSGRCDNCNNAHFKSSVGKWKFIRECSSCGLKKSI